MTPELQPRPSDRYYTEYAGVYDERTVGAPGDIAFYWEIAKEADGPVVELGVGPAASPS